MSTTRAARERRLLAGLCVALVVLVGGISIILTGDEGKTSGINGPSLDKDTVRQITLVRPDRRDIVLARSTNDENATSGDWRLVAPCAIAASTARIDPFLSALTTQTTNYPTSEVDLDAASLTPPLATIRLDDIAFALGSTDITGERRYVQSGDRVTLVPEWVLSLVDGGLSAIADPAVFPDAPQRIQRIDDESHDLDLDQWKALSASQIVSWPIADAPPIQRRSTIEITDASGGTQRLALIGTASWNALLSPDGNCARLFANDDLPPDSYR